MILVVDTVAGRNQGNAHEETLRRINTLDAPEGKKIRYKVVLGKQQLCPDMSALMRRTFYF